MTEVRIGSVAISERGRDKGRIMAVLNVEGQYALVADGRKRKVESPKRKKLCHLSFPFEDSLEGVERLTNKGLWKRLEPYRHKDTKSSET